MCGSTMVCPGISLDEDNGQLQLTSLYELLKPFEMMFGYLKSHRTRRRNITVHTKGFQSMISSHAPRCNKVLFAPFGQHIQTALTETV